VAEWARVDEISIELFAGESLLLYTDGITEARDPNGEMFGENGIIGAIREPCDQAQSIIFQLQQSLDAHQDGNRPNDDQTMVAIHVHSSLLCRRTRGIPQENRSSVLCTMSA
jgi:sigma-B regulation protein RsbU (phosphoserine phosphatase)